MIDVSMAGSAIGAQLKMSLKHENFCIYEKGNYIGGTWSDNREPETLEYIHRCARHSRLESHTTLQQDCRSVSWSKSEQIWTLSPLDIDMVRAA
ncbi:hypothetical protein GGR51DRAFT_505508 [Nemania sp. FL0031]|nr:hypothetical protein GGR51DRAFT_505508 [Nemania sp. FL0031]